MTTVQITVATDLTAEHGVKIHHATKAKAMRLASALAAEYPVLTLAAEIAEADEGEPARVVGWSVSAGDFTFWESESVPDLADVLVQAQEDEIDLESEEEEEAAPSGSVVPEHYRALYRTVSSNGQTCGDWLAEWLVAETTNPETGGFVVGDFTAIAVANDLDMTAPWARLPESGQKGWVGRYRMNGRQALERAVAVSGVLRGASGEVVQIPEAEAARIRGKHAKLIARLARKAAADGAGIEQEEGGE